MNANKPDIAQIQKYLNGELDAKAMHLLEREAQDDPFLMDALEGYQNVGRDQTGNLLDVKARFAGKAEKNDRQPIALWRILPIAALIFVALTVGLFWYSQKKPDEQSKVISQKNAPVITPPVQNKIATAPHTLTSGSKRQVSKQYSSTIAATIRRPSRINKRAVNTTVTETLALNTPDKSRATNQVPGMEVLHSKTQNLPYDITQTMFTGSVTDPTGHALAGVKVTVKGTDHTVVTDSNGVFNIVTPNAQPTIKVAYSGYNSKQVTLSGRDSLKVILNESVSELAEISVPGYIDDKPAGLAHPLLGWKAFKDYIKKNAFMANGETGRVKLAFKIAKDGSITGIRVIRGKSEAMNQKAIALLMNGPEWSSQNDSRELKLKIRFRRLKTT